MNEAQPHASSHFSAPVLRSPAAGTDTEGGIGSRPRIFLIDDNQDMLDMLQPILSERWSVESFSDGASALEGMRRSQPDLIVSDVRMPGVDGLDLLRQVRADPVTREIPVVLISSMAGEHSLIEALEAQVDDYVEKPFSTDELLSRVASRLEMTKLRREMLACEKETRAKAEAAYCQVKTILESISDGFASFDREWRCTYVNERALHAAGKRSDELLGKRIWDVFPELIGGALHAELQHALSDGVPVQFEQFSGRHGAWYQIHAYPWRDGIAVYGHDITKRKRAEAEREQLLRELEEKRAHLEQTLQALEKSDQRYRALGELIPFGIWECDAQGGLTYASNAFLDLIGRTPEECLGLGWLSVVPAEMRDRTLAEWKRCIDSTRSCDYEFQVRGRDGKVRTILSRGIPLRDPNGSVANWVGMHLDITERVATKEALLQTEHQLRQLVEANIFGVFIGDRAGKINYANRAFLQMLGYSREEMLAESLRWTDLTPAEWKDADERAMRELGSSHICAAYEKEYFHKEGHRVPILTGGTLIEEADGSQQTIIAFVLDLTERKRVETDLEEAKRQITVHASQLEQRVAERTADWQEVAEQMEAFCYTVAHDLRAPLRAMFGFAQALFEDYGSALDETGKGYAARIVAAAHRLDLLIQDLLTYSRLSRVELGFGQVNLDPIWESLLGTFSQEIRSKNAVVEVQQPLPKVLGHSFTIQQLFWHLLSNGLKFVAPGVQPHLRIWAEESEQNVRIWIEDNGIGIAQEHQERIFRVFERLHPFEAYPGTGIGLAIVRKGAERMGGRAGVQSEFGHGSRFWIELRKADQNSRVTGGSLQSTAISR